MLGNKSRSLLMRYTAYLNASSMLLSFWSSVKIAPGRENVFDIGLSNRQLTCDFHILYFNFRIWYQNIYSYNMYLHLVNRYKNYTKTTLSNFYVAAACFVCFLKYSTKFPCFDKCRLFLFVVANMVRKTKLMCVTVFVKTKDTTWFLPREWSIVTVKVTRMQGM